MAQTIGVAVGKVGGDLQPFPALAPDGLGFTVELLGDEPVEQHGILQPATIVLLEQVPHHHAAGNLIGFDPDELRALVGSTHARPR